jgi:AhpC/TSA family
MQARFLTSIRVVPFLAAISALLVGACSASAAAPITSVTGTGDAPDASSESTDAGTRVDDAATTTMPPVLPTGWGAQACVAPSASVGFAVGESIGDLQVKDCETDAPATINDLCGASATWIFSAHTHCPTCQSTAGFTDDVAAAVAQKNVAIAHLVYDDNGTSCAKWRDVYKLAGITNVRVFADPSGTAFAKLKTSNYTAPSAFLDKNRVITFKQHGMSKAQVLTQIDAALAK